MHLAPKRFTFSSLFILISFFKMAAKNIMELNELIIFSKGQCAVQGTQSDLFLHLEAESCANTNVHSSYSGYKFCNERSNIWKLGNLRENFQFIAPRQ